MVNFARAIEAGALKSLILIQVLTPLISFQNHPDSQPVQDGSWLFALKGFSEIKFPASMLPSNDPLLLDVTLTTDEKGRVHSPVVTPTGTPFSDAAVNTVQKWRFTPGHSGDLKAHICLGRDDNGHGIGLPCYVYGPEKESHLRVLLFSSSDLKIESPVKPALSALAEGWVRAKGDQVLWAHARVLICEDGSVAEAQTSGDIVDQELARDMKRSLRFRPVHLSGHTVEAVADVFMQAPRTFY